MHRKRIIERFSSKASLYGASPEHSLTDDVDIALKLVSPSKDDIYLDIACGTGHAFFKFLPFVGKAFALDISLQMLFELKKRNTEALAIVADAHAMPFRSETFTLVSSRIAPHHFTCLNAFLKEVYRILVKNGRLVIIDSAVCDDPELKNFIEKAEKMRDPTHLRTLTFSEWKKTVSLYFDVIGFQNVRKKHPFNKWLERAPVGDEKKRKVEEFFKNAPSKMKRYFEIKIEKDRIISYTDDKIVIAGVKKQKWSG